MEVNNFISAENIALAKRTFERASALMYNHRVALYGGAIFAGLYAVSRYSYLLFHSLSELFTVAVAGGIFMISWNSRRFSDNAYFTYIGTAFLFISGLDLIHTLSYRGLGIISDENSNIPTQLWIAARYFQALVLLSAPFIIGKKIHGHRTLVGFGAIASILLLTIFYWDIFPTAFVEGYGLTTFKIASEYIISLILLLSIAALWKKRQFFDQNVFKLLIIFIIISIFSELAFSSYAGVYDWTNMAGHFLKIIAFFFLYQAVIQISIKKPYTFIFRNLKKREEELAKSEEKFRLLADFTHDWEYWLGTDGNYIYVSPSCERITGYEPEEFYKNPAFLMGIVHPDDVKKVMEHKEGMRSTRGSGNIDYRIINKKADVRWINHRCQPVFASDGTWLGRRGSNRDITNRKHIERLLQDSLEYSHSIVDTVWQPLLVLEKDMNIRSANQSFYEVFKRDQEHVEGKSFFEIDGKQWNIPALKENIRRTLEQGESFRDLEIEMQFRRIGRRVMRLQLKRIQRAEEKSPLVLISIEDISERKEAERQVRAHSEELERLTEDLEKFRLAVENASDHIVITDTEGVILYANKGVERITGFSRQEIIGQTPALWGRQMNREFYEKFWNAIKAEKQIFVGELINRRKNGEKYIAEARVSPILDDEGNVKYFVGIERDVTKAKEIDRAKSEFISIASHQLRTPLTSINLSAEMLLMGIAGEMGRGQKQYLKEIIKDIKGMAELIEALLNVSRIEMGMFVIDLKQTSVPNILEDVLREVMPQIKARRIKIEKQYAKNIPEILADRNILKIVLQNLVSNSVKYTHDGGTVTTKLQVRHPDLVISVSDTGYGIPKHQQDKIFTKLFRADNVVEMKAPGTGLGLYVVKAMVTECGGQIWFSSKENRGTTFYVSIPLLGMKKKELS